MFHGSFNEYPAPGIRRWTLYQCHSWREGKTVSLFSSSDTCVSEHHFPQPVAYITVHACKWACIEWSVRVSKFSPLWEFNLAGPTAGPLWRSKLLLRSDNNDNCDETLEKYIAIKYRAMKNNPCLQAYNLHAAWKQCMWFYI